MTAKGRHGAEDMSRDQAKEALSFLFSDEVHDAQIAAFLTAMRFKGTKHEEYLGFFDAIQEHSRFIQPGVMGLLNMNGPYDGRKHYLQLSVATALTVAASGQPVVLHSSSGLPPKRGVTSGMVLEDLGIPAYLSPENVQKSIETNNFGFLHASVFSFGIEKLRPVREVLFYRSFLHSCEVLMNPAGASSSVIGAAHDTFLEKFADVQKALGVKNIMSVQGLDGSDQFPMRKAPVAQLMGDSRKVFEISPSDFGLKEDKDHECVSSSQTAKITLEIFQGGKNHRDAVVYNAGIRLFLAEATPSIEKGIELAEQTIESGAVMDLYERLKRGVVG